MISRRRAQKALSALAVASLFAASALPSAYALSRCRMTGQYEATPCCGHEETAGGAEAPATARASPCCERVSFQIDRLPGAESSAPRPQAAATGAAVAVLDLPPATATAPLRRWSERPRAASAGPPIFLEICSLLI